jgi:hypothetical protein
LETGERERERERERESKRERESMAREFYLKNPTPPGAAHAA